MLLLLLRRFCDHICGSGLQVRPQQEAGVGAVGRCWSYQLRGVAGGSCRPLQSRQPLSLIPASHRRHDHCLCSGLKHQFYRS